MIPNKEKPFCSNRNLRGLVRKGFKGLNEVSERQSDPYVILCSALVAQLVSVAQTSSTIKSIELNAQLSRGFCQVS